MDHDAYLKRSLEKMNEDMTELLRNVAKLKSSMLVISDIEHAIIGAALVWHERVTASPSDDEGLKSATNTMVTLVGALKKMKGDSNAHK